MLNVWTATIFASFQILICYEICFFSKSDVICKFNKQFFTEATANILNRTKSKETQRQSQFKTPPHGSIH